MIRDFDSVIVDKIRRFLHKIFHSVETKINVRRKIDDAIIFIDDLNIKAMLLHSFYHVLTKQT